MACNVAIKNKSENMDLTKAGEKSKQVVAAAVATPSDVVGQAEKVHIPDSFDDSDADSETLSDKLWRIDACTEVRQGSKQSGGEGDHQVWRMEVDEQSENASQVMCNAERSKFI